MILTKMATKTAASPLEDLKPDRLRFGFIFILFYDTSFLFAV